LAHRLPPPPGVFVRAESKGLAGGKHLRADSARLKVAVFSAICERLVRADCKGLSGE
jgi:hypothetical protein